MPVIIKDFEVVGNENGSQQPAEPAPAQPPSPRPLSARQVARMMKYVKERARRLHAD